MQLLHLHAVLAEVVIADLAAAGRVLCVLEVPFAMVAGVPARGYLVVAAKAVVILAEQVELLYQTVIEVVVAPLA